MKNNWPLIILIAAIVLGGGYYFFVNKKVKNNPPIAEQEEISEADLIAKNLADKYQAKTDWDENSGFTIELQEQLITGEPILFRGYVEDIFSHDDKKFIRLSSFPFSSNYIIELECNQQIIDSFLKDSKDSSDILNFDEYAVVADVKEIFKPIFKVGSSVQSEDYAQIEIDSSDLFIIKGICIDIARLEDNPI